MKLATQLCLGQIRMRPFPRRGPRPSSRKASRDLTSHPDAKESIFSKDSVVARQATRSCGNDDAPYPMEFLVSRKNTQQKRGRISSSKAEQVDARLWSEAAGSANLPGKTGWKSPRHFAPDAVSLREYRRPLPLSLESFLEESQIPPIPPRPIRDARARTIPRVWR